MTTPVVVFTLAFIRDVVMVTVPAASDTQKGVGVPQVLLTDSDVLLGKRRRRRVLDADDVFLADLQPHPAGAQREGDARGVDGVAGSRRGRRAGQSGAARPTLTAAARAAPAAAAGSGDARRPGRAAAPARITRAPARARGAGRARRAACPPCRSSRAARGHPPRRKSLRHRARRQRRPFLRPRWSRPSPSCPPRRWSRLRRVPPLPGVPLPPEPGWQAAAKSAAITNVETAVDTLAIMPPTARALRSCSEKRAPPDERVICQPIGVIDQRARARRRPVGDELHGDPQSGVQRPARSPAGRRAQSDRARERRSLRQLARGIRGPAGEWRRPEARRNHRELEPSLARHRREHRRLAGARGGRARERPARHPRSDCEHRAAAGPPRERRDRRHDAEPLGRRALDRGDVGAPQPSVPTAGRRHRRAADRRRGRLPDGSDGHGPCRRGFVVGDDDRFRRRHGRPERRDGSRGRTRSSRRAFASSR